MIAIYRLSFVAHELLVEPTPLCFAATRPELEVASLYADENTGEHVLFFSAHPDEDYLSRNADKDGIPVGSIAETGCFYEARLSNLRSLLLSPPEEPVRIDPVLVSGIARGSYANRLVAELGGISLGFDLASGLPALGEEKRKTLKGCPNSRG